MQKDQDGNSQRGSSCRTYQIVYADPPWQFKVWSETEEQKGAEGHYDTLGMATLRALPVPAICAEDCVLLMWATFPLLESALELGRAWGFEYKTVAFVWVKVNPDTGKPFFGLGYYTRANAELVLLFTRGKPLKRMRRDVGQLVMTRVGPHSQKPAEVRERIVQLFGELPRVELFARSRPGFFPDEEYRGWDVFGNQVNGSIEWP